MASTAIIYTGPSNPTLGLRNRAIYSGGTPEHLRKTIESNSALANYFVPLARYAKTPRTRARVAVSASTARGAGPAPKPIGPPIKKR
jgi:hypothetical protein